MSKQPPNPAFLADLIENHRTGDEPAAAPQWDFDPNTCGDFGIRIGRDGTWYYHGTPIGRKPMCKLFSTVLRRDDAGNFYLVTPVEAGRIDVDDAPFTAVEVISEGTGEERVITFRTNLDHMVTVLGDGKADAVLAASIFHFGEYQVKDVKEYLSGHGIPVRPIV